MDNRPKIPPTKSTQGTNLLGHPMAGVAAASAISFGIASQMLGIWVGAMRGATESAERMLSSLQTAPLAPRPAEDRVSAVKARAAAVMAEASLGAHRVIARQGVALEEKPAPSAPAIESPTPAAEPSAKILTARPAVLAKPKRPDDLKRIPGIGPKLEKMLNGIGVWTFRQIAGWTPAEAAWVDDFVSAGGRIGRDGWVEQAAKLAKGRT